MLGASEGSRGWFGLFDVVGSEGQEKVFDAVVHTFALGEEQQLDQKRLRFLSGGVDKEQRSLFLHQIWLRKEWEGQQHSEDRAAARVSVKLISRFHLIFYIHQQAREEMSGIILK